MNKLIITEKMKDFIAISLKPSVWVMALEGSVRSVKTTVMIQAVHFAIQLMDESLALFSAENLNSIRDVLLNSDMGLLTLYPELYTLEKAQIGGYYIAVKNILPNKPVKRILLCGFDNKSSWEKINGKQFGVIVLDESNMADPRFVDECLARQTNVNHPKLFLTLNGDRPDHPIYTKVINHCQIIGEAPASIIKDMSACEKKKGYYYQHFTMEDNPTMTPEKLERAKSIYPVGSYYYKIKILGERGSAGALIFNEYLDFEKQVKDVEPCEFDFYTVGCDIGATGAKNSLTLIGWKKDFSKVCVIDNSTFKQVGYGEKKQIILSKLFAWRNVYKNIECICVDSAEQNFLADLKVSGRAYGFDFIASYKSTIKERIDLIIILLSLNRLSFNNNEGAKRVYNAYLNAKWEENKTGQIREDNNEEINDIMDATEYALTRHMKALLNKIDLILKGA